MKALHLLVRGRVQGVGYRAFAASEAVALGITGYVRNRDHRRDEVEILAHGMDEELNRFIERLQAGPPGARVTEVEHHVMDAMTSYEDFSIRY